tara:strand:+ start:1100 stop:1321 length:222 start_codon:yes stop_codon:yes gene_type:complete
MNKKIIVQAVREVLEELSTTAGVGSYLSKYAFGRKGVKNRATKKMEKLGYKLVKNKKRPYSTKLIDYLDENVN